MSSLMAIGDHRLTNESIEHPLVDTLVCDEQVSILYCDPPWGEGNMEYWRTLNRKHTGKIAPFLTFDALLSRIIELAANHLEGHLFIENGPRWWEMIAAKCEQAGFYNVQVYWTTYKSGSRDLPCPVVACGTGPEHKFTRDVTMYKGAKLVDKTVEAIATPGGVLLDPCCGMGYSAKAAVNHGMRFRGNELNSHRLLKTIAFLEKNTK